MNTKSYQKDPDYETPGVGGGLFAVFKHRYLLKLLLHKGVATRYYGSILGWAWSYVRPGAQFLMYYLVIGLIMGTNRDIPYFPIYLFTGIATINLFTETLRNTTTAIVDNSSLVKKIYLPRELFPVSAVGVAIIHFLPQAALLFLIVLLLGWQFSWLTLAALLLGFTLIIIFALGIGMFFGAINVAYRDARNIVDLILMFSTWLSPVLYSWKMVHETAPGWLYRTYMMNPLTQAVELWHDVFWLPLTPDTPRPPGNILIYTAISLTIAITTLIIGQLVFKRLERGFAQNL